MDKKVIALAALGLFGSVLPTGCAEKDAARQAAQDARDITMVERMSREPFEPIVPTAISSVDITRYGLDRPGCVFRKTGGNDPLFIAAGDEGFMRIGGDLRRYAAKLESAQLPGNARATYVGLSNWIDLMRRSDAGTGADEDHWPARLIVHDARERVAFMADGAVTCTR